MHTHRMKQTRPAVNSTECVTTAPHAHARAYRSGLAQPSVPFWKTNSQLLESTPREGFAPTSHVTIYRTGAHAKQKSSRQAEVNKPSTALPFRPPSRALTLHGGVCVRGIHLQLRRVRPGAPRGQQEEAQPDGHAAGSSPPRTIRRGGGGAGPAPPPPPPPGRGSRSRLHVHRPGPSPIPHSLTHSSMHLPSVSVR